MQVAGSSPIRHKYLLLVFIGVLVVYPDMLWKIRKAFQIGKLTANLQLAVGQCSELSFNSYLYGKRTVVKESQSTNMYLF